MTTPEEYTQVVITGGLADEIARLGHFIADLTLASGRMDRAEHAWESDGDVAGDAFEAGLVAYARPFHSGVERRLSLGELPGLTGDELAAHQQAYGLRNMFAGHSVNGMNRAVAVAGLADPSQPRVLRTTAMNVRIGPGLVQIRTVRLAAEAVAREVRAVQTEVKERAVEDLNAGDVGAMYALPQPRLDPTEGTIDWGVRRQPGQAVFLVEVTEDGPEGLTGPPRR